ncbi:MAG TPA: histidinol-phosphate transaminase [Saprospiraceae bacterium]|nr:histidinol-phosphate transaminase [Saprospiraceae bacterium]
MTIASVLNLVRPNVAALTPYSSARDEFTSEAKIFLDANENPYNWAFNRYPDPYQTKLKQAISAWRGIETQHIFIGNGSDEIIDLLIRAFCEPKVDNILTVRPSYGMYKVSADINEVNIKYHDLDEKFGLDFDSLLGCIDNETKILFLCSPNNPSGNCISIENLSHICRSFNGLVVVDEAYIDFASTPSMVSKLKEFPNSIILQTLSKAMGAAGIRLGLAFMHTEVVAILNKIKPPYNVNSATQEIAIDLISDRENIDGQIQQIIAERDALFQFLKTLIFVEDVFPSEANFILVKVKDVFKLYDFLLSKGIVARNRDKEFRCERCIRFTIGTPEENEQLKQSLLLFQQQN